MRAGLCVSGDPSAGDAGMRMAPIVSGGGDGGAATAAFGVARPGPPGLSGVLVHAAAASTSAAESTRACAGRKGCFLRAGLSDEHAVCHALCAPIVSAP
jgi:hypothetical protein